VRAELCQLPAEKAKVAAREQELKEATVQLHAAEQRCKGALGRVAEAEGEASVAMSKTGRVESEKSVLKQQVAVLNEKVRNTRAHPKRGLLMAAWDRFLPAAQRGD
jgi:chromosome segregation ATPase